MDPDDTGLLLRGMKATITRKPYYLLLDPYIMVTETNFLNNNLWSSLKVANGSPYNPVPTKNQADHPKP